MELSDFLGLIFATTFLVIIINSYNLLCLSSLSSWNWIRDLVFIKTTLLLFIFLFHIPLTPQRLIRWFWHPYHNLCHNCDTRFYPSPLIIVLLPPSCQKNRVTVMSGWSENKIEITRCYIIITPHRTTSDLRYSLADLIFPSPTWLPRRRRDSSKYCPTNEASLIIIVLQKYCTMSCLMNYRNYISSRPFFFYYVDRERERWTFYNKEINQWYTEKWIYFGTKSGAEGAQ